MYTFSLQRNTDSQLLQVYCLWYLFMLSRGSQRFPFVTSPSSWADATAMLNPPGPACCCSVSLSNTTSLIIKDVLAWDIDYNHEKVPSRQPSKWATSDTTTGLMSEEGPLVILMVGSKEGPSWGTVLAGWPREATIYRKSERRWPVTATPLMALVATLEELFKLEPRRGVSQCSRAWKHL